MQKLSKQKRALIVAAIACVVVAMLVWGTDPAKQPHVPAAPSVQEQATTTTGSQEEMPSEAAQPAPSEAAQEPGAGSEAPADEQAGGVDEGAPSSQTATATSDAASTSAEPASSTVDPVEPGEPSDPEWDGEASTAEKSTAQKVFTMPEGAEYVPDEVLVSVADGMDTDQLATALADGDVQSVNVTSIQPVTDDLVKLTVAQDYSTEDAVNELETSGVVAGAQPNYIYQIDEEEPLPDLTVMETPEAIEAEAEAVATEAEELAEEVEVTDATADDGTAGQPEEAAQSSDSAEKQTLAEVLSLADFANDPELNNQWGLTSINAKQAWKDINTNRTIGVAVIDAGFNVEHEDLKNVIAEGSAYNAARAVYGGGSLTDVSSGSTTADHGNHVAGIIAAESNNGIGVAGVSYNNVQIVPIRAYHYGTETGGKPSANTATMAKAFQYAREQRDAYNIRVINMSMGARRDSYDAMINSNHDKSVLEQIDAAFAEGIVTVCSAGNKDTGKPLPYTSFPSDYTTVVSVISLAQDSSAAGVTLSDFSNFNDKGENTKDISAPGSDIYSTFDSTSSYGNKSGTSMAAPHVSGVLAMMFATNPTVRKDQDGAQYVVDMLYSSARKLTEEEFSKDYGYGEVDAGAAVQAMSEQAIAGPSYVKVDQGGITFSVAEGGEGWTFSSSNSGILEVSVDGASCAAHATGSVTVIATSDTKTLRKPVNVLGPIEGQTLIPVGASSVLSPTQPAALAWTWESSNTDVATVTTSGTVTAKSTAGTATVTATLVADPNLTFTTDINVVGPVTGADTCKVGDSTDPLSVTVPEGFSFDGALVWESVDTSIATVGQDGKVAGVSGGTTTIRARNDQMPEGTYVQKNITVLDDIARSEVQVSGIAAQTYTGSALKPAPTVTLSGRTLKQGTDYELTYANNVNVGTATVTIKGIGAFQGSSRTTTFVIVAKRIAVPKATNRTYNGSAQVGVATGTGYVVSGTARATNAGSYTARVTPTSNYAWTDGSTSARTLTWSIARLSLSGASMSGIGDQAYTGAAIAPAVTVSLGGRTLAGGTDYDLAYANNVGEGTASVTATGKGNYTGSVSTAFRIVVPHVTYRTHVQKKGWQGYVWDGAMSGTSGKSLRLEGINIKLSGLPYSGGIKYRTHVQKIGWQGWKKDGAMSGTKGKSLRLEAIQIQLTGELANHYDVYYRVHAQKFGWMGWARNGAKAGTAGYARRLEGIQIVLVPKGQPAPGSTFQGITTRTSKPFRQK